MKPTSIVMCKENETVYVEWENGVKSKHGIDAPVWVHGNLTRDIKQKLARELNVGDDVYYTNEYVNGMFACSSVYNRHHMC